MRVELERWQRKLTPGARMVTVHGRGKKVRLMPSAVSVYLHPGEGADWQARGDQRRDRDSGSGGERHMATVLIKNGRIVTAVDDYQADILIEDGRIHTIGQGLVVGENVETHDASGLLVLPGGVDVHTHLDWDFGVARTVDTFGTGTQAA